MTELVHVLLWFLSFIGAFHLVFLPTALPSSLFSFRLSPELITEMAGGTASLPNPEGFLTELHRTRNLSDIIFNLAYSKTTLYKCT